MWVVAHCKTSAAAGTGWGRWPRVEGGPDPQRDEAALLEKGMGSYLGLEPCTRTRTQTRTLTSRSLSLRRVPRPNQARARRGRRHHRCDQRAARPERQGTHSPLRLEPPPLSPLR
eukprot:scaffold48624_cov63-Phaeocystis_antarctica.AAC.3